MAAPATPIVGVSDVASPSQKKKKSKTNEGAKVDAAALGTQSDAPAPKAEAKGKAAQGAKGKAAQGVAAKEKATQGAKGKAAKASAKVKPAQGVAPKATAKAKPKASPVMKKPGASSKTVKAGSAAEGEPNKVVKQNASQKAQAWKDVLAQKRLEELMKAAEEGDADKWNVDYGECEEEDEQEEDACVEVEEAAEEGSDTNAKRDRSKTAAYKRALQKGQVEPHIKELIDNSSRSAATALVNKLFKLNKATRTMEIQQHLPCFAHKKTTKETDSQVEGISGLLKYL